MRPEDDTVDPTAVSVVIATHERATLLAQLLDALDGQSRSGLEVLVVDDESTDETPQLLRRRGIRSLRVTRRGPGRARQAGWQAAAGEVVAFTDDDCVPTQGWVEALTAPLLAGEADFAQGRTLPRPDQLERSGPWSRTQHVEAENGFYQTCNMAYRRQVLVELGGFHSGFSGPRTSGEDAELGWRAREAGYRFVFVPEAVVHHAVSPSSYWAWLRDRRRWGMIVQVVREHPASRSLAYRRYFYRPSHLRTLVGLGVLAAAGTVRPWAPLALVGAGTAVYAIRPGQPEAPWRRALRLGQVALADSVEVAVFAAASIRYRTVLL